MLALIRSWWERRELRRLVKTMRLQLRRRYGAQEFYTQGQVEKTCEHIKLDAAASERAVAMYVEPKVNQGILTRFNGSQSANELRKYLIVRCFDGFSEGDQTPGQNPFMHSSTFENSGTSEHSGSFDDGHSGGDFGGGHH
jgi:hypothetical protein